MSLSYGKYGSLCNTEALFDKYNDTSSNVTEYLVSHENEDEMLDVCPIYFSEEDAGVQVDVELEEQFNIDTEEPMFNVLCNVSSSTFKIPEKPVYLTVQRCFVRAGAAMDEEEIIVTLHFLLTPSPSNTLQASINSQVYVEMERRYNAKQQQAQLALEGPPTPLLLTCQ